MSTRPLWHPIGHRACAGLVTFCLLGLLGLAPWVAHAAPSDALAEASVLLARNIAVQPSADLTGLAADLDASLPGDELGLLQALLQATWPADIVRLADGYLRRHGQHAWAIEAASLKQRALVAATLLRRNDVPLFRAAFVDAAVSDDGALADAALADVRLAALGDATAAWRQADRAALQPGAAANPHRRVGWLHYAAALGSAQAAYALSLHYRAAAQPLLAAQLEARAAALGHVLPKALDHARK